MEFWNSLLIEKSWKILQDLKKEHFRFIVIGGWAAYLWTQQHKSKDIDIILPELKDLTILKQRYSLQKNDHLKKYEVKFEDLDLDIYVPYYSQLTIPVHDIAKETAKVQGFEVVLPEVFLLLKQGAEFDRRDSIKGQKDRIDIMTLLCYAPLNFKKYDVFLDAYNLKHFRVRLKEIVQIFQEYTYLQMNAKDYAKKKKELLVLFNKR